MKNYWLALLLWSTGMIASQAQVDPDINLKQGATNIASNGSFNFGTRTIGASPTSVTFTIQNTTADTLHLNNVPFAISGSTDYSITTQPATDSIAGVDSLTFIVRFSPSCGQETKNASITIQSDDPDEGVYVLNLTGFASDGAAPVARCFSDTIVYLNSSGTRTITESFLDSNSTDNCGIVDRFLSQNTFDCGDRGNNLDTLFVYDENDTSFCQTTIVVRDTIDPIMNCSADIDTLYLSSASNGLLTLQGSELAPFASDNCGIDTITTSPLSFNCSVVGLLQPVIITATDSSGNSGSCSRNFRVLDSIPPVLDCKSSFVLNLGATLPVTINQDSLLNVAAGNNCSGIPLTYELSQEEFGCDDIGSAIPDTLTVTDGAGNISQCFVSVIVQDIEIPVAQCQSVTLQLNASGGATLDSIQVDNGSSDNCGIAEMKLSKEDFSCTDVGTPVEVIFTVIDVNGLEDTCKATITVEDNIPPEAECKDSVLYLKADGTASVTPALVNNASTDNCSLTPSVSPLAFDCDNVNETEDVLLTVLDPSNNSDVCIAKVEILDTLAPSVSCKIDTFFLDNFGLVTIIPDSLVNTFSDNCDLADVSFSVNPGQETYDCSDVGFNLVNLFATDASGNIGTCGSSSIVIRDTIAPTAICRDVTVYLDENGLSTLVPDSVNNGSSDNCGVITLDLVNTSFDCEDIGLFPVVTLTVEDDNDNSDQCTATITVLDTVAPFANCIPNNSLTVYLDSDGEVSITPDLINDNSEDNCETDLDLSLDVLDFVCPAGTETVTLTVADDFRSSTCSTTIIVADTITPNITCPGDIERCEDDNEVDYIGDIVVTDNCPSSLTLLRVQGDASGADFDPGVTLVEYEVSDGTNTANCSFQVTVYEFPTPANAGNDETICDTLYTLGGNVPTTGVGEWTLVSGTSEVLDSLDAASGVENVNVGTNIYEWAITEGVCPVSRDSVTVTRDDFPTDPDAGEDDAVCNFNFEFLQGNVPTVGIGVWRALDTEGQSPEDSTQNITEAQGLRPGENTFTWNVSNGVCPSKSDTVVVRRDENPSPASFPLDIITTCDQFYEMEAVEPVIGEGQWTVISGAAGFINAADPNTLTVLTTGETLIEWRTTNGVCDFDADTITFRVAESLPEDLDSTREIRVCEDTVQLVGLEIPEDAKAFWGVVLTGSSSNAQISCQECDTTEVWGLTDGVTNRVVLEYDIRNEECPDDPRIYSVSVIRDDQVSKADAGIDQEVCTDSVTFLNAEFPSVGSPTWTSLGSADVTSVTDVNTEITGLVKGPNDFVLTITGGNCIPSSDSVTIFRDGTPPTIVCPKDTSYPADRETCEITVSWDLPIIEDNCPLDTLTQPEALTFEPGDLFPVGVSEVIYKVTDGMGDTARCSFTIGINDITAPQFDNVNCDTIIQRIAPDDMCGADVNFPEPVIVDACDTDPTIDLPTMGDGDFFGVGLTTLSYSAVDSAGNDANCEININVRDRTNPVFNDCPTDTLKFIARASDCQARINFTRPTATDNCTGGFVVDSTGAIADSSFLPGGIHIVTYTATDSSGNDAVCSFVIEVQDTVLPVISCPDSVVVVQASPDSCEKVVFYQEPTLDDDVIETCTVSEPTLLPGGIGSGGIFPVDTTIDVWQVTDIGGNTATCQVRVIVQDTVPPEVVCPATIPPFTAESGTCSAVVTNGSPSASDFCSDDLTITQTGSDIVNSGDTLEVGTYDIEFTYTDDWNNQTKCAYEIEVRDVEAPVFTTCVSPDTAYVALGNCTVTVGFANPVAEDNCSSGPLSFTQTDTTGLFNGAAFSPGVTVLTYTASDGTNEATCEVNVVVLDTIRPTVTCPPNVTLETNLGACEATLPASALGATAIDNCTNVSDPELTITVFPGLTTLPLGINELTYEASDSTGNVGSCSFTITVEDNEAPVFETVDTISLDNDPGTCSATHLVEVPEALDNCSEPDSLNYFPSSVSTTLYPVGITQIQFIVFDESGNSDTVQYVIEVSDAEGPGVVCPLDTVLENALDSCGAFYTWDELVAADIPDNCEASADTVFLTSDPLFDRGSYFPEGSTIISYTTLDAVGNDSTCSFSVTVEDRQAPEISCSQDTIRADNDPGLCEAKITLVAPVITDNCTAGILPSTNVAIGDSIFPVDTTVLTYVAVDDAGLQDSCSVLIIINDSEGPSFTQSDSAVVFVTADTACNALYLVETNAPSPDDNCADLIDMNIYVDGNLTAEDSVTFTMDSTIVNYVAVDPNGNQDTLTRWVVIQDLTPPQLTCPSDTIWSNGLDSCGVTVFFDIPEAGSIPDNCGFADTVYVSSDTSLVSGRFFPFGATEVILTAEDEAGNEDTCSFTVIVVDEQAPQIICPDDTTIAAANGLCTAIFRYDDPAVFDNCDNNLTPVIGTPEFSSSEDFPIGRDTVEWSVQDVTGNEASCTFVVTVEDRQKPQIDCPDPLVVGNDFDQCSAVQTLYPPFADDNCGGFPSDQVGNFSFSSGSPFPLGETVIPYLAIDSAGNESDTCFYSITVEDQQAPRIECDGPFTLCAPDTVVYEDARLLFENCTFDTLQFLDGQASGTLFDVGSHEVRYLAVDSAGNETTCSILITVYDTTQVPNAGLDSVFCDTLIELSANSGVPPVFETWELVSGNAQFFTTPLTPVVDIYPIGVGTSTFRWIFDFDVCGVKRDEVTITRDAEPSAAVILTEPDTLCDVVEVDFLAENPAIGTGQWVGGLLVESTDSSATIALDSGVTTISWVTSNGTCENDTAEVNMTVSTSPVFTYSNDTLIYFGETVPISIALDDVDAFDIQWNPETGLDNPKAFNPEATPEETTLYSAVVTNLLSQCVSEVEGGVTVEVSDDVKIVSAFTPDGDDVNDSWDIRGYLLFPNMRVEIYNAWGKLVFDSDGYEEAWDGTYNQRAQPFGTYYYVVDLKDGSSPRTGTVTILK